MKQRDWQTFGRAELETVIEQVCSAILDAMRVYREPTFFLWAEKWIRGSDRKAESAHAAVLMASRGAAIQRGEQETAALAARAAAHAARLWAQAIELQIPQATQKVVEWAAEAAGLAESYRSSLRPI